MLIISKAMDRIRTPFITLQDQPFVNNVKRIMGAYIPDTFHLEEHGGKSPKHRHFRIS